MLVKVVNWDEIAGEEQAQRVKNRLQFRRHGRHWFDPWVGKIPWRKKLQPTPVFLLKNPTNRRAWQATIQRAAKSGTRLND